MMIFALQIKRTTIFCFSKASYSIHSHFLTPTTFHSYKNHIFSLSHPIIPEPSTPTWNPTIRKQNLNTDPLHEIAFFNDPDKVYRDNSVYDPYVYASLIKGCTKLSAFRVGKSIHGRVLRIGLDCNANVVNSFIYLYLSSRNFVKYAYFLFDKIPEKNVVTVNCMISGIMKNKEFGTGFELFNQILRGEIREGLRPNFVTLLVVINGCVEFGRFEVGKALHSCCWKMGFVWINEIGNALVDLYAKHGDLDNALRVFGGMRFKDLVSWNTMLGGYARSRSSNSKKAYALFKEMVAKGVGWDRVSLINLLMASANCRKLDMVRMVHGYIKYNGVEVRGPLGAVLIRVYSDNARIDLATKVFREQSDHDIESVNAMIHGYVDNGQDLKALDLFHVVKSRKLEPDEMTMVGLISACRNSEEINQGIALHCFIESSDFLRESTVLQNALIDMYAKCSKMDKAKALFNKMTRKDVFSWTSIIVGHAINGEGEEALVAFRKMVADKVVPNAVTFLGLLFACDHAGLVNEGRQIYDTMLNVYRVEPQVEHYGCMVDMLARAGLLEEAYEFVRHMPVEPSDVFQRMLVSACRVHGKFDMGLNLVSLLREKLTALGAEDHVVSSSIFAEVGRWDNVLKERCSMVSKQAAKVPGKSLIPNLTVY